MATFKQRKAVNKMLEEVRKPDPRPVGTVLAECGYKKIAKQPSRVLKSKGFQEVLAEIDDKSIVKKWQQWALSDKDKRVAMEAGKEIMKLKDRYPAQKSKIVGLFDTIKGLENEPEKEVNKE